MREFAETIGCEDNDSYKKFNEKKRLTVDLRYTKFFVIKFVF